MNEESEYCLRWHKHLSNLIESFGNLLENEALADVYFFAEGQLVKAHKVVLSSCSTYFQKLFKETIDRHPIIVLKDVKIDHIKALLEFMYRGMVNVPQESLEPIMKMAQSLNIKGLADGVVEIEKIEDNDAPMSLIHPKIANSHYNALPPPPPPSTNNTKVHHRHIPDIYHPPSTSVQSVLSTALTMPSALSLASPLSIPPLASLPRNLVSSLASTLSNAQSIASFMPPHDIPLRDGGESPMMKRRRKHRRRSGETIDSGDSDCRSSGSPGDSVSNLQLPRIPATITPIGLHRQQFQQYHPHNSPTHHHHQQQPRDLSIHSSHNHSSSHTNNNHERSSQNSPHPDRAYINKPHLGLPPNLPGLLLHTKLENHHHKVQDEPENLEHRPSHHLLKEERGPNSRNEHSPEELHKRRSESPHPDKSSPLTSGRRSDEGSVPPKESPKCGSDPDSLVSPAKAMSNTRLDETSSDNNHYSDDEKDENSNGHKEPPNERLSDSTPGPSTSRPQSEEAPQTNFLGWPYSSDPNSSDETFPNFSGDSNHDYLHALNLVRAGFSGILPPRMSSELYAHPSSALGIPLLLKRDKSAQKNLLGYPFPETPKQYTCEKCGRSYASSGNLKRHKKYECGVEPQFSCPICKKKFQHRHSVKIHVFSTHRNEGGDGMNDPQREGPAMFSTPDGVPTVGVPTVGTASWAIPHEAPTAAPQNQEG